MTRRFRPPAPVAVHDAPDGTPRRLRRGRRTHTVTRITATWIRPAAWWSDEGDAGGLDRERIYYRVVLDEALVYELFRVEGGGWYVERILD